MIIRALRKTPVNIGRHAILEEGEEKDYTNHIRENKVTEVDAFSQALALQDKGLIEILSAPPILTYRTNTSARAINVIRFGGSKELGRAMQVGSTLNIGHIIFEFVEKPQPPKNRKHHYVTLGESNEASIDALFDVLNNKHNLRDISVKRLDWNEILLYADKPGFGGNVFAIETNIAGLVGYCNEFKHGCYGNAYKHSLKKVQVTEGHQKLGKVIIDTGLDTIGDFQISIRSPKVIREEQNVAYTIDGSFLILETSNVKVGDIISLTATE